MFNLNYEFMTWIISVAVASFLYFSPILLAADSLFLHIRSLYHAFAYFGLKNLNFSIKSYVTIFIPRIFIVQNIFVCMCWLLLVLLRMPMLFYTISLAFPSYQPIHDVNHEWMSILSRPKSQAEFACICSEPCHANAILLFLRFFYLFSFASCCIILFIVPNIFPVNSVLFFEWLLQRQHNNPHRTEMNILHRPERK